MNLVFDFGGVLFEWQPAALLQRALPHLAGDAASARRLAQRIFQGYGGDWAEFDRGAIAVPEVVRRIAARTGLDAAEVQSVVDAVPGELRPIVQTVALLERLRDSGQRLFYLSNMPLPYAEHLEREHALVGWFERGVFSARVRHIKPEAAIFAQAERHFGVDPAQLLLSDGLQANVDAARRRGWNALRFIDAAGCEAQLRRGGWA